MALSDGLVSFWKLEEASGSRADAVGSNTLTDNNTVTQAAGKIGNAASFAAASTEYLSVADNASLDFTSAFSFSCWIYIPTLTANMTIAAKWTYSSDGCWSILCPSTTALRGYLTDVASDIGDNLWTTGAILTAATWHHVVMSYDGTQTGNENRVKVYFNNVDQAPSFTGTIPAAVRNSGAALELGRWNGLGRYWGGRLDAVGLWSRALNTTDVSELWNGGAGIEHPFSAGGSVIPALTRQYRARVA